MNVEDRRLLILDLCMRVPYGLKIHIDSDDTFLQSRGWDVQTLIGIDDALKLVIAEHNCYKLEKIKPYLRPMESMTDEELNEFLQFDKIPRHSFVKNIRQSEHWYNVYEEEDWLNEHHFDYRGLIR